MSYCKQQGKDQIIFVTKEDHEKPSAVKFSYDDEEPAGLIAADGNINWNCPCLGGMAGGPCGVPFREAFSCFHYSKAEPKGSDCYEQFSKMQDCMSQYPNLYPRTDPPDLDEYEEDNAAQTEEKPDAEPETLSSESSKPNDITDEKKPSVENR